MTLEDRYYALRYKPNETFQIKINRERTLISLLSTAFLLLLLIIILMVTFVLILIASCTDIWAIDYMRKIIYIEFYTKFKCARRPGDRQSLK